jgi:hypothetical protein
MVGVLQVLTAAVRHAVPIGGIFGGDWHPATAVAVYWVESVLLALATAWLCVLMQRRVPPPEVRSAGIVPGDVLLFQLGSFSVFGAFLGGVLLIMVHNGHIPPLRWGEIRQGVQAMVAVVGFAFLLDLWRSSRLTVQDVAGRVNEGLARWFLFWVLGFFGTWAMMASGRPEWFFGLFAGLKVTFETWGRLARMLGWRSLKDRERDATT